MKLIRSSTCHFSKFATEHKQQNINKIIDEYARVCNIVIDQLLNVNCNKISAQSLSYKEDIAYIKTISKTWFSSNMMQNIIREAHGMVKSYQSALANPKMKNPQKPKHYGKKITLSQQIATFNLDKTTSKFDLWIHMKNIGDKLIFDIPLKRNRVFNKWNELGMINKSIVLTKSSISFSFEVETDPKKEIGYLWGLDLGIKTMGTFSSGVTIGENLESMLLDLQTKETHSNAWYRKKREIREYITTELKSLPWEDLRLIVCENLKGLKYKMKEFRRVSKKTRRVISDWSYRYVLNEIKRLCEINCVSFRSISPFNTSRKCSCCGYTDKGNRRTQEYFECLSCGYSDNADLNASQNILGDFLNGQYGAVFKTNYVNIS